MFNNQQLNEQVFEQRNKVYGAYAIRKNYNRSVLVSALFAASLFLAFGISSVFKIENTVAKLEIPKDSFVITVIDFPPKVKIDLPVKVVQPKVLPKLVENNNVFTPSDTAKNTTDIDITKTGRQGDPKGTDSTGTIIVGTGGGGNQPIDSTFLKTFEGTSVDANPEFPGGYAAMMKFLKENIKYPTLAKEEGIFGTVFLSFVIDRDGNVTGINNLNMVEGGCTKEAVRVVGKMPKWTPGKYRGQNVSVKYTLPIKFSLK